MIALFYFSTLEKKIMYIAQLKARTESNPFVPEDWRPHVLFSWNSRRFPSRPYFYELRHMCVVCRVRDTRFQHRLENSNGLQIFRAEIIEASYSWHMCKNRHFRQADWFQLAPPILHIDPSRGWFFFLFCVHIFPGGVYYIVHSASVDMQHVKVFTSIHSGSILFWERKM